MAGQAVIGALRVTLGMNSAAFEKGLKNSQSKLANFGRMAARGMAVVGVAATAAAAAIGVAVRRTITEADNMTKLAQSIGVPVEELTRLKHAADLSGVGIEGLSKSLGRLSRGMTDIATGAGLETKKAFDALGVSVTNSDGTLKSSTQVMTEIAGKFAMMEDGAAKTGLAMTIFGRSGAALIPMLNQGADGLSQMMAEADRLGIVLDKNTGQAAEAFNDNLTRLGKVKDGIILKITAGMLPALERLSDVFINTANDTKTLADATNFLSGTLKVLVSSGMIVGNVFSNVGNVISGVATAIWEAAHGNLTAAKAAIDGIEVSTKGLMDRLRAVWEDAPSETQINRRVANAFGGAGKQAGEEFKANFIGAAAGISDKLKELASQAMDGLKSAADATNRAVGEAGYQIGLAADYTADRFEQFFDGIRSGESVWESLRNVALGVLEDISRAILRSSINNLFTGLFGGSAMAPLHSGSPLFGAGDFNAAGQLLPGFATGGSILPGGSGGIDSQVVAFRKSPSEQVDIYDPRKAGSGSNQTYAPVYNIDARGSEAGVEQKILAAIQAYDRVQAPRTAVGAVQRSRRAGVEV